jgi:hypothetical protein
MLDDTILQGRLTIDAANKVAIHEQLQLGTFDGYAEQGFADFERIANSGTRALNATTETAQAATRAIGTVDSTIAAGKPLLEAFTQDGKDLDSRINDPHVTALVAHLAGMSASGDKMLVDLNVWEHPFLNPEPCTTKKCQFGRYIWPVIKTGLGLGADANQVRLLTGHPLPVSVHP